MISHIEELLSQILRKPFPIFPHLLHHTLQRGCWMVEAFPLGQKEEAEQQAQQQAEQAELDLDPVGGPFKRAKSVILLKA